LRLPILSRSTISVNEFHSIIRAASSRAVHDGWLYLALGDNGVNGPQLEGDRLVFFSSTWVILRGGGGAEPPHKSAMTSPKYSGDANT
jgi:hypothetical protein